MKIVQMKNSNTPQNWKTLKFKYAFSLNKGLTITKEDLRDKGVPCVNYGEIHSKYSFEVIPEKHTLKYVESEYVESSPNMLLSKGNFIFADTSEDIEGVGNFTCLNSNTQVFAGYHTIIARLKIDFISRYYAYFFDSDIFRNQIRNKVSGIKVFSITQGILKNTNLLVPPLQTQQKIANFLDSKCSKIDSTIEQEKQHIEKLKEYRQSFITEAVTKGLDKNAPMKDSGIEWIGEIPQAWETSRIKNEFENLDNLRKPISSSERKSGIYDYYGASGVIDKINSYIFDEPLLLIGEDGANLAMRNLPLIYKATGKYWVNNHAHILRPKSKNYLDYWYYSLECNDLTNFISGSAQPKLTQDSLANIPVVVPPLDEQKQIADYLDKKTAQIDNAIAKKETLITKLQECKKSLIFEAVTGKMEV